VQEEGGAVGVVLRGRVVRLDADGRRVDDDRDRLDERGLIGVGLVGEDALLEVADPEAEDVDAALALGVGEEAEERAFRFGVVVVLGAGERAPLTGSVPTMEAST
jgi:hypothetical protein